MTKSEAITEVSHIGAPAVIGERRPGRRPLLLHQNRHPRPAVVDIRAEEVGRAAGDQLARRIANRQEPRTARPLAPRRAIPKA